jgi:hypothetical protein
MLVHAFVLLTHFKKQNINTVLEIKSTFFCHSQNCFAPVTSRNLLACSSSVDGVLQLPKWNNFTF